LTGVLPAAALEAIPFAFSSQAEFMKAANGPLGAYLGSAAAKLGLYKFGTTWYGGAWQMQNNLKPIVSPDDLKGIKIRVPPNPVDVSTFRAFGANPVSIGGGQMYIALQTKLVDAVEVPLTSLQTFKLFEVVKYVAITNHNYLSYSMLANADSWQKIPKNLQTIIEHEFNSALSTASAAQLQSEETVEAQLKAEGMIFNRPNVEPFRQVIRNSGLYAQWRDQFAPQGWPVLEKSAGKLIT
jgi:TRAP-type C4-dicarboxylate transport system substrate-binding protein